MVTLPILEEGKGARRSSCHHLSECLGRWVKAHKRERVEKPAQCPADCSHYRHFAADDWSECT